MSTGPLGSEGYQKRRRERDKLVENQWDTDLRSVASTPTGRRLLWGLLGRCSYFAKLPIGNEGLQRSARRDLAVDLLNDLFRIDEHAYRALWAEGNAEKSEEAVHAKDAALSLAKQEQEE